MAKTTIGNNPAMLGMVDLTRDFESTCETVSEIISKVDFEAQKLVILLNKTDIFDDNKNVNILNNIVSYIGTKGFNIHIVADCENSGVKSNFEETGTKKAINILPISAKTGSGISSLRELLASTQRDLLGDSDTTLVTNQRHVQALSDARTSLLRVRDGLAAGLPTDLAAEDLRLAIYSLGTIIGEISTQDVLINIFQNFCIGK